VIRDVQFNSATTPWPQMREAVLAAEEAGYGIAWTLDHIAGQMMGGDSMLECCTLTGALAAITTSIGIGTLVVNVWNRPCGVLAAAAATMQNISGGRFWLGVGAGASPKSPYAAEHAALGIDIDPDIAVRHARVTEFLDLARRMWHSGEIEGVHGFPRPIAPIPIMLGVNSVSLAKTAALEADAINVRATHDRLEEIIDAARAARPACAPPLIVTTWARTTPELRDPDSPASRQFERIGIDRLILVQVDRADTAQL
jgi:alkanesulfonate monooxygenase SsuD/methylene tetrahydromethanopterin reductase-like flavin-dependent oxidoreductase (luciferase family)